jgi:hypothetical protein
MTALRLQSQAREYAKLIALQRRATYAAPGAIYPAWEITGQAIRRGSFDRVRRLEAAIMNWLSHWNDHAKPFRWSKSAAEIKRSIRNAALWRDTTLAGLILRSVSSAPKIAPTAWYSLERRPAISPRKFKPLQT